MKMLWTFVVLRRQLLITLRRATSNGMGFSLCGEKAKQALFSHSLFVPLRFEMKIENILSIRT